MRKLICFLVALFIGTYGFALPIEMQVISGEASATSSNFAMQITASDKTILHWKDFSIAKGEMTQILLPNASSQVLNRVVGEVPSQILGQLQSNGQVFLINPNGVIFGVDAKVDTAALIASTLEMANDNFLAGGNLMFQGTSVAAVVNLGAVTADEIVLIGNNVENQGSLNGANVFCGTGTEVLLQLGQGIFIKSEGLDGPSEDNIFERGIRFAGRAEANGVEERNGRIFLVADEGQIDFTGSAIAESGEIRILGNEVYLHENAFVDVSGDFGGGTILVGGAFQGIETPGPNALYTVVDKDVTLKADALVNGPGGKVINWADKTTHFRGSISAQGGPEGGNGGLVEVSGKEKLSFCGTSNTLAPLGKTGTLLLDPGDFQIEHGAIGTSVNTIFNPGGCGLGCETIVDNCPGSILTDGDLNNILAANNVEVTNSGCSNIHINNAAGAVAISWASTSSLTITSSQNLTMDSNCTIVGAGSITLATMMGGGGTMTLNGQLMTNAPTAVANITLQADRDITINNNVLVNGASMFGGDITIQSFNGNINVLGNNNPVEISSPLNVNNPDGSGAATITLHAADGATPGTVSVVAGPNGRAQVGNGGSPSSPPAGYVAPQTVTCNIFINTNSPMMTNGNLVLLGSSAVDGYAQIGHGGPLAPPTMNILQGNIFNFVNNIFGSHAIQITGGSNTNSYAQIGHTVNPGAATTIGGVVQVKPSDNNVDTILGDITLLGGSAATSYALIGHGGIASAGVTRYQQFTPAGCMGLNCCVDGDPALGVHFEFFAGNLFLTGGTADQTYAAIGFTGNPAINFHDHPKIDLGGTFSSGVGSITLQSGTGGGGTGAGAYVGYFFYVPGGAAPGITMPTAGHVSPCQFFAVTPEQVLELEFLWSNYNMNMRGAAGGISAASIGCDALAGSGNVGMWLGLSVSNNAVIDGSFGAAGVGTLGSAFIQDGIGIPASIVVPSNSTIAFDTLTINSGMNSPAGINGTGALLLFSFNDITLNGTATQPSYINSFGLTPPSALLSFDPYLTPGSSISSLLSNIIIQNHSQVILNGPGTLMVVGANDVQVLNTSQITSTNSSGNITVVVDQLSTPARVIGPGKFVVDPSSLASGGSGQLRIYTARFSQNTQMGTLQGVPFTGTALVNDPHNEYCIYFTGEFGDPQASPIPNGGYDSTPPAYRVYYKEGCVPPAAASITSLGAIPNLFPYDMGMFWTDLWNGCNYGGLAGKEFSVQYTSDLLTSMPSIKSISALKSTQVLSDEYYLMMMKKYLLNQDPL